MTFRIVFLNILHFTLCITGAAAVWSWSRKPPKNLAAPNHWNKKTCKLASTSKGFSRDSVAATCPAY